MENSKEQKPYPVTIKIKTAKATKKQKDLLIPTNDIEYEAAKESLMPELEELVKKNPNRLIGCGG